MSDPDEHKIAAEICVFAEKYGLLGFVTALPATPEFMNYETAYLSKNRFIRHEIMTSDNFVKTFFPFDEELNKKPKKQHISDNDSVRYRLPHVISRKLLR